MRLIGDPHGRQIAAAQEPRQLDRIATWPWKQDFITALAALRRIPLHS
jgi:hypothetical protein